MRLLRPFVVLAFVALLRPMQQLVLFISALVVLAVVSSAPAGADDAATCRSVKDGPDPIIGACTRLIQSKTLDGRNLAVAFNNRGRAYSTKGQYDLAIADFDQALHLSPDRAAYHYDRGLSYEKKGEREKAIADYRKVRELGSSWRFNPMREASIKALRRLGVTDQEMMRWSTEAQIASYDRSISRNPNDAAAYGGRCLAYKSIRERDKAIVDCDEAVRLAPNSSSHTTSSAAESTPTRGTSTERFWTSTRPSASTQNLIGPTPDEATPTQRRASTSERLRTSTRLSISTQIHSARIPAGAAPTRRRAGGRRPMAIIAGLVRSGSHCRCPGSGRRNY